MGAGVQPVGVLPEVLLKVPGGVAGRGGGVGLSGSGPLGVTARAAKRLVFLPDIVCKVIRRFEASDWPENLCREFRGRSQHERERERERENLFNADVRERYESTPRLPGGMPRVENQKR